MSVMQATSQGTLHLRREARHTLSHHGRSVVVQRVIRVRLNEKEDETEDDGVDSKYGLPVIAQNVEAHITVRVDVRMIDLRLAFTLRGVMRIVG